MSLSKCIITAMALAGAVAANDARAQASKAPPAAVEWVKRNAFEFADVDRWNGFADLQPLKRMIGNARIVALGEGTHGTHEFFAFKRRLTEFLAREMGFTIFAIAAFDMQLPAAAEKPSITRRSSRRSTSIYWPTLPQPGRRRSFPDD